MKIAVLLTCYNRVRKTLHCLEKLYDSFDFYKDRIEFNIYLTDDNSDDGTFEKVSKNFPDVITLKGEGFLYWAGGMRNSWKAAVKDYSYDGYLLLNDDTFVFENLFQELFDTDKYSLDNFDIGGIYVGSTLSAGLRLTTYGGRFFRRSIFNFGLGELIEPNNTVQECELGNANVMFVSKNAFEKLGILSDFYVHGAADFDYCLRAKSKNIPVLVMPNHVGICESNMVEKNEVFQNLSLKERYKYLTSPTGFGFLDYLNLQKSHFRYRYPFVVLKSFLKVLMPKLF